VKWRFGIVTLCGFRIPSLDVKIVVHKNEINFVVLDGNFRLKYFRIKFGQKVFDRYGDS
jgi:hypothetical protein